eukprot:TRINITY_DN1382_c0_g1_i1.p1 TRINITY_DN1382_c0_g1~~TRINITY_DN1382_c0_g1_i1.p1  ORF type:complete len:188 (-),score=26.61 TRINITY_DN1382_c0_g1_i1:29-526(-)
MGGPGWVDGKLCLCVDNFGRAIFVIDSVTYCSAENYFQCQKCVDEHGNKTDEFERVRRSGEGASCWMAGSNVKLRRDWEVVKVKAMYEGNLAKFQQNPNLAAELKATKGPITFDNSTPFWCKWNGRIMELIREELRDPGVRNEEVIQRIRGMMLDYENEHKALLK